MTVEANWARIIRWCEQHAPATAAKLLPPAKPEDIRAAETSTGRVWSEQLRQWFTLHDGSQPGDPLFLLPRFAPISAAAAVDVHGRMTELWQGMTDDLGGSAMLMAAPAGEEAGTYLPAYVPIGEDGAGDYLVIDTRSGDRQGCVVDFFGEGVETLQWASIEVMLDSTATALEQGTDCEGWVPVVEHGLLRWDFRP